MNEIATGSLVKHVSLGVGKVIAVEPTAVHVFFPQSDKRRAAKLRWPTARPLLTREGVEPDAWLTGLTSFALDPETRRYTLAANFLGHDGAIAEFLEKYPRGFEDPVYPGAGMRKRGRAAAWRTAGAAWAEALGGGQGERLLADGELRQLIRRALRVGSEVTRVPGTMEQDALEEALQPGDVVTTFFDALFALLAARPPARPRFDKLLSAAAALGVTPDLAWPMLTLFPSIADPARYVFLAPRIACGAAARLGCDLRYDAAPSWTTYAAWRGLAEGLLEELAGHGARNLADVEAFLHGVANPGARKRTSNGPRAASLRKRDPPPRAGVAPNPRVPQGRAR